MPTLLSGSPAAPACSSTSDRRTACIATRSAASLKVVSSAPTSTAGSCRNTCSAHAESLPDDQARRIFLIHHSPLTIHHCVNVWMDSFCHHPYSNGHTWPGHEQQVVREDVDAAGAHG